MLMWIRARWELRGVARLTCAPRTTGTMVLLGIPLNVAEELRADLVRRADERMAAL